MKKSLIKLLLVILVITCAFIIGGCASVDRMLGVGAEANDELLRTSEFTICKAASVGAVIRRYKTKELADAWVKLCMGEAEATPLIIESNTNE